MSTHPTPFMPTWLRQSVSQSGRNRNSLPVGKELQEYNGANGVHKVPRRRRNSSTSSLSSLGSTGSTGSWTGGRREEETGHMSSASSTEEEGECTGARWRCAYRDFDGLDTHTHFRKTLLDAIWLPPALVTAAIRDIPSFPVSRFRNLFGFLRKSYTWTLEWSEHFGLVLPFYADPNGSATWCFLAHRNTQEKRGKHAQQYVAATMCTLEEVVEHARALEWDEILLESLPSALDVLEQKLRAVASLQQRPGRVDSASSNASSSSAMSVSTLYSSPEVEVRRESVEEEDWEVDLRRFSSESPRRTLLDEVFVPKFVAEDVLQRIPELGAESHRDVFNYLCNEYTSSLTLSNKLVVIPFFAQMHKEGRQPNEDKEHTDVGKEHQEEERVKHVWCLLGSRNSRQNAKQTFFVRRLCTLQQLRVESTQENSRFVCVPIEQLQRLLEAWVDSQAERQPGLWSQLCVDEHLLAADERHTGEAGGLVLDDSLDDDGYAAIHQLIADHNLERQLAPASWVEEDEADVLGDFLADEHKVLWNNLDLLSKYLRMRLLLTLRVLGDRAVFENGVLVNTGLLSGLTREEMYISFVIVEGGKEGTQMRMVGACVVQGDLQDHLQTSMQLKGQLPASLPLWPRLDWVSIQMQMLRQNAHREQVLHPENLVYDRSMRVRFDNLSEERQAHLLHERLDRFPDWARQLEGPVLLEVLEAAVDVTRSMHNSMHARLVCESFDLWSMEPQWLVPVDLGHDSHEWTIDLVVVVRFDAQAHAYVPVTVLRPRSSLMNARLMGALCEPWRAVVHTK